MGFDGQGWAGEVRDDSARRRGLMVVVGWLMAGSNQGGLKWTAGLWFLPISRLARVYCFWWACILAYGSELTTESFFGLQRQKYRLPVQ